MGIWYMLMPANNGADCDNEQVLTLLTDWLRAAEVLKFDAALLLSLSTLLGCLVALRVCVLREIVVERVDNLHVVRPLPYVVEVPKHTQPELSEQQHKDTQAAVSVGHSSSKPARKQCVVQSDGCAAGVACFAYQ